MDRIGDRYRLVSYIIPCRNAAKNLHRTLDSIIYERERHYPNLEIIVIDGGSDDGTVDVIRSYSEHLAYWISEPDGGPADAFRKGIKKSTGELIRYIAGDDELFPGASKILVEFLLTHPNVAIVAGSYVSKSCEADLASPVRPNFLVGEVKFHHLALWGSAKSLFAPECALFRRNVFEVAGYWRGKYRYACDLDYWFLVLKCGLKIVALEDVVLIKYSNPNSVTHSEAARVGADTQRVLNEHAGRIFVWIYTLRYSPRARLLIEAPFKALGLHPLRLLRSMLGQGKKLRTRTIRNNRSRP